MSWGQKYRIRYYDLLFDIKWEAKLELIDYAGAITDFIYTDSPIIVNFPAREQSKVERIKGRSVIISIINQTFGEHIEDFLQLDRKRIRLQLYKNDALWFVGLYVPNTLTEQYLPGPNRMELEFNDGLGYLRNVKYRQTEDIIYSGKRSQLAIIHDCLTETGLELDLEESCYFYEDSMNNDAEDSPLNQCYLDAEHFVIDDEDITCYEVLDRILSTYVARLFQNNGIWHIVPIENFKHSYNARRFTYDTSHYVFDYAHDVDNYILITGRTDLDDFNGFVNTSQVREIDLVYKNIKVTQDYKRKQNFIKNNEFKWYNSDDKPILWNRIGSKINNRLRKINTASTNFIDRLLYGNSSLFEGGSASGVSSLDRNNYIYQSFNLPAYSELLYANMKFTFECIVPWRMFISFDIRIDSPYLISEGYYEGAIHFRNVSTVGEDGDGYWWWHKGGSPIGSLPVEMRLIADYNATDSDFNPYQKFSFTVEGPMNINYGETDVVLSVKMHTPYPVTHAGAANFIFITNIGLEFVDSEEASAEKTVTHEISSYSIEDLEYNIHLGDLPDISLNHLIYTGGLHTLYGSIYSLTSRWRRQEDSGSYDSLIDLIKEEIAVLYNKNRWKLTGQMIGHFDLGARYIASDGRIYLLNELNDFDLRRGSADISLLEIDQDLSLTEESGGWMEWTDSEGFVEWTDSEGYVEPTN